MPTAWLNGELVDEDAPQVSLRDTGLLHAAGVFTTLRAEDARVFRLAQHLKRLRASCEALFIPLQFSDADLEFAVAGVLQSNRLQDARMRITVTRGQSRQDPVHGAVITPNCFITAAELQAYPASFYAGGMTVVIEDEQKLNPYDLQAGHKTVSYLSRLAAMRQAANRGAGEALWFNVHNYLQSGSISNVFLVKDGTLLTPTAEDLRIPAIAEASPYTRSNVLPGIIRAAVLQLALGRGIPVKIQAMTINELLEAHEVFLTNSIMQVMPVGRIEKHAISAEAPGPITRAIMEMLYDATEEADV